MWYLEATRKAATNQGSRQLELGGEVGAVSIVSGLFFSMVTAGPPSFAVLN